MPPIGSSSSGRLLAQVLELQEVDDLLAGLAMSDVFLLRHAPVDDAGEDAGLHAHVAAEHQVVEDGQAAEQGDVLKGAGNAQRGDVARLLLRDVLAFEDDAAGVRLVESRDHVQEGGLARAVGADDGDDRTARHVERHILHGDDTAETLGYAFDHKLIVALSRSHAPGRRPRHESSLKLSLVFAYNCQHHAGSDGRTQRTLFLPSEAQLRWGGGPKGRRGHEQQSWCS